MANPNLLKLRVHQSGDQWACSIEGPDVTEITGDKASVVSRAHTIAAASGIGIVVDADPKPKPAEPTADA